MRMRQVDLWDEFYEKDSRAWRGNSKIPIPCGGRALDLGCGSGKTLSSLIDAGFKTTGMDFSKNAVECCRRRFGDGVELVEGPVDSLPFDDCSFNYVTAVHILENLDDEELERTASEVWRVLFPGGYLFCRTFTPEDMRSEDRLKGEIRYRYFSEGDLERVFMDMEMVSSERIDEVTRFGTIRSRMECLLRKPGPIFSNQ